MPLTFFRKYFARYFVIWALVVLLALVPVGYFWGWQVIVKLAADGFLAVIAVCGGVALVSGISRDYIKRDYPYAIMAGITSLFAGKLFSLLYQQSAARPFLTSGVDPGALYVNNPGFPSDHALLAGVIVAAVFALTPYKKLSYFLATLAIMMGTARVIALVHTPIDVLGGFAAVAIGCLWYMSRRDVGTASK